MQCHWYLRTAFSSWLARKKHAGTVRCNGNATWLITYGISLIISWWQGHVRLQVIRCTHGSFILTWNVKLSEFSRMSSSNVRGPLISTSSLILSRSFNGFCTKSSQWSIIWPQWSLTSKRWGRASAKSVSKVTRRASSFSIFISAGCHKGMK